MSKFEGFEIVSAASLGYSSGGTIKITVSNRKVTLPKTLIVAMGKPTHIGLHRGTGENEGKIIIAVADDSGVQINLEKKRVCFSNSGFTDVCSKMIQTYAHGSFRRGTYFSISGVKLDEGVFVFDFRNAREHNVRVWSATPARNRQYNPAERQMWNNGAFPGAK